MQARGVLPGTGTLPYRIYKARKVIAVLLNTSARLVKRWLWDTHARIAIGIGISLLLGWLSVNGVEWGLVIDQFQSFPIGWAVASLAILILSSFLRAYRWQTLFVQGKVSLAQLFLVQNTGIGLNSLVPVRVVSEGAQFVLLTMRYRVNGGVAVATLGVERILDMVVTAVLLMAGLTLLPSKGDFLPYVVGAFVVAVASVLVVPFVIWLSGKPLLSKVPILVATATFLQDLTREKAILTYAFLLSLAYWLMVGLCAWVLAHGMGLGISPFVATLAILGTLYFATALPALPAAVGTFEFAIVYVLKFFDVPQTLAFSYGIVVHAVLFLPPIVVALVVFFTIGLKPRNRMDSARILEREMTVSTDDGERRVDDSASSN